MGSRTVFLLLVALNLSSGFSGLSEEDRIDLCAGYGLPPRENPVQVFDGFTFFTELDVLEARLYELYPVVKKFILVESPQTHSRISKPLHFQDNQKRFSKYADKIEHVIADLPAIDDSFDPSTCAKDDTSCKNRPHWYREGYQRVQIGQRLGDAQPEDILIISDVDEIPSRETVQVLSSCHVTTPMIMRTHFYYYDLRWLWLQEDGTPFQWKYPQAVTVGDLTKFRVSANDIRYFNPPPRFELLNAGWHLSYFGGADAILHKIRALAHQENNIPTFTAPETIAKAVREGKDLFGRDKPHGTVGSSGARIVDGALDSNFLLPLLVREQPQRLLGDLRHWLPAESQHLQRTEL